MSDEGSHSCGANRREDSRIAGQWPLILLTIWGGIIAALVAWLDKNPLVAIAWLAVGVTIGCLAPFLFNRLCSPLIECYQQFWNDRLPGNRSWELLSKITLSDEFQRLIDDGRSQKELEELADFALSHAPESEEYKRLIDDELFGAYLGLPIFLGLIHGGLLGGILGALCPLDLDIKLPAWQGAALGVVIGPIAYSFLAAVVLAAMPMPKDSPVSLSPSRRALLAVSPILAIPVAWRCLVRLWRS